MYRLSDLRHYLPDFYSPIGRRSIDPELMIHMLIVGYCYGLRSERRLCEEAHLNLAYRWFCRLSLEDEVPNHSTFSKNRHGRFWGSDLFPWLFNDTGLVKGEEFSVDARASSMQMRFGSAAYRAMNRSTGAIRRCPTAPSSGWTH